jgi:hypothetical protein
MGAPDGTSEPSDPVVCGVGAPNRTPITQSPQAIPRTSQLSQSMIISCSLVGRVVPDTADVRSDLRQFFATECPIG